MNYIWPNRDFVMVCARPTEIHRDAQGRLHNEHGKSIRYPDGWGLYHLHGVRFDEALYLKVVCREMSAEEILKITDIDQRVQAMRFAKDGIREFFKTQKGRVIDRYAKPINPEMDVRYELWHIPSGGVFNKDVAFAVYDCPTALQRGEKREYAKGVPVGMKTIPEVMAWGSSSDDFPITPDDWKLMGPLRHEA